MSSPTVPILGLALAFLAESAAAQFSNLESPGNLKPTQNPGCVSVEEIANDVTPADLALGTYDCVQQKDFDAAIRLFLLMGLRAEFDKTRVSDETAHMAGAALSFSVAQALSPTELDNMRAASDRFGAVGADAHSAMCKTAFAQGPPTYFPAYMIEHGIGAFTGERDGDGLVEPFNPQAAWQSVLRDFAKCSG